MGIALGTLKIEKYKYGSPGLVAGTCSLLTSNAATLEFNGRNFILNYTGTFELVDLDFSTSTIKTIRTVTYSGGGTQRAICTDGRFYHTTDGSNINSYDENGNLIRGAVALGSANHFGITTDGHDFWLGRRADTTIRKYSRDGNLIRSFTDPTINVGDLWFDGRYLWAMHNDQSGFNSSSLLAKFDPESGNQVQSWFVGPAPIAGSATHYSIVGDGRYLYVSFSST